MHLAGSYPILTGREEHPASSVIPLQLRRGAVENTNVWVQSGLPNLFQTDPVAITLPACPSVHPRAHTRQRCVNALGLMDSQIHPYLPHPCTVQTTCVLRNWCDRLRLTVTCFCDFVCFRPSVFAGFLMKVGGFWFSSNLTHRLCRMFYFHALEHNRLQRRKMGFC